MDLIDPCFTPQSFQKLITPLNRNETTLLNRLRSNHIPLYAFLHRIKWADSHKCVSCEMTDETTRHFLYECQSFREIRRETLDRQGLEGHKVPVLDVEGC